MTTILKATRVRKRVMVLTSLSEEVGSIDAVVNVSNRIRNCRQDINKLFVIAMEEI